MQVPLGDTYYFKFTTRAFATGIPTTLAGTPVISVYEENNLTQITAGITLTADYDSVTGLNDVAIVASSGNGYEVGKYYSAVITTGTVSSVSVVGETVGHFRVMAAEGVAGVPDVNTTHVSDTVQTANDNGADINNILLDTAEIGTAGAGLTNIGTIATVTNLTNLPTIPANWITAAGIAADAIGASELAADAVTEIQSGLATPTNITSASGVTLAATTGLGNQTANITGNLTGSVGSVTGAVGSVAGNVDGSVASVVGAVGSVTGAVGSVTNDLSKYSGPRGPGVYLNDAAANTNTTSYTDGIITQPVSTIAAAKTIADALSLDRIYLVNDSAIDLTGLTMNDYEFVGIGAPNGNSVALASQDVDGSDFYNLTITGVQGGTARVKFEDCIIGTATLHLHAIRCGFTDAVTGVSFSNNDDNIMDGCYSMVAGNSAPIFICSGANLDISIRHYSGGLELKTLNATATASIEADGQVIFNADCNTGAAVTMRGNLTITDNTGGMSSLTTGAVYDKRADITSILADTNELQTDDVPSLIADLNNLSAAAVNAEVVDALATDTYAEPTGVPAATDDLATKIGYIYMALRNQVDVTATKKTFYDDGGVAEWEKDLSDNGTTYSESEANAI